MTQLPINKAIVDVDVPSSDIQIMLDVAGQFAYRTRSIARFFYNNKEYLVWYEEFTHGGGWKATRNGNFIPRDNGRWGRFVPEEG